MGNPPAHRARKRFGQHFLHDRDVIERILQALDPRPGQSICEIGPGRGALTVPLLQRCRRLTAIELDRDLAARLPAQAAAHGELELIAADALDFDFHQLPGAGSWRLVGNLPYNISTPLLFHLYQSLERIEDMHFMLQKEVAARIVAEPGTSSYGRLSVMLQLRCDCHELFDVAPDSFTPPPRVNSSVIRMLPLARPRHEIGDAARFARIVETAFNQRRKTVANSLRSLVSRDDLIACEIDPRKRAENLAIEDYARLSRSSRV
ncbi:MAG: 16S rRNA (adenine(1518)-N(6)/adenine(1519)-N(6))-dimethyltransferase RsmA [Gammaproteobacteria bacterium]|nr:16S rRNA (adenine(1518)-N(6)/adenine(1519)-N(6))-dimethyltransferase RsmA [Gammaproteobacteria bacterium]